MGNVILHEMEFPVGMPVEDAMKCLDLYPLWVRGSKFAEAALRDLGARLFIGSVQLERTKNYGKR